MPEIAATFIWLDRSYAINLAHVATISVDGTEVVFKSANGTILGVVEDMSEHISQHYAKNVLIKLPVSVIRAENHEGKWPSD